MVQTIINPSTGRQVNVYGKLGQQILRNYQYQSAGGKLKRNSRAGRSKGRSKRRSKGRSKRRSKRGSKGKSKRRSKLGRSNPWVLSVKQARKELGITGFLAVKKGTPLYKKAKAIHNQRGGACKAGYCRGACDGKGCKACETDLDLEACEGGLGSLDEKDAILMREFRRGRLTDVEKVFTESMLPMMWKDLWIDSALDRPHLTLRDFVKERDTAMRAGGFLPDQGTQFLRSLGYEPGQDTRAQREYYLGNMREQGNAAASADAGAEAAAAQEEDVEMDNIFDFQKDGDACG